MERASVGKLMNRWCGTIVHGPAGTALQPKKLPRINWTAICKAHYGIA